MSVVTFGFLALMVLIGGVVALLADNLGRRIGKKRFKIHHKIRPRHTATLFVVGSGLLIPLVTVALVSILSSDVRTWLLEGERAIAEAKSLRSETTKLKYEVAGLKGDIEEQKEEKDRIVEAGNKRLATLNREVQLKTRQRLDLQGQLGQAQNRLGMASLNLASATNRLETALASTSVAEGNKQKAIRDFKEALKQRDDAYTYTNQLQSEISAKEKDIRDRNGQIEKLNESIRVAESDFARRLGERQIELAAKQKQLDDLNETLQTREDELVRVNQGISSLLSMNETTRTRRLAYALGDEVARSVIAEDLTTTQARNQLNSLLRTARVAAEANGASGQGRVGAAGIFDREIGGRNVTAEQQTNEIVARIAGVPQSRILIASAIWNSFANEPVWLVFDSFPNVLCFKEGDVISEVRIDGDLSSGQVISMLGNWLSGPVREAALKAGMIPAKGRPDALANVAPEDVFDLVAQIKSDGRVARVQALAFADTYSAGPLKLVFRIR